MAGLTYPAGHLEAVATLVEVLAEQLSGTGALVPGWSAPPEVSSVPYVAVAPASTWADRRTAGGCVSTAWDLHLTVPRYDVAAGLAMLLEAHALLLELIRPPLHPLGPLTAPVVEDLAGTPVLTATMLFSIAA